MNVSGRERRLDTPCCAARFVLGRYRVSLTSGPTGLIFASFGLLPLVATAAEEHLSSSQ
jgi:hypothetical protein